MKAVTDPAVLDYLSTHSGDRDLIALATRDVAHFIAGQSIAEGPPLPVMEPSCGARLCQTFEAGAKGVDAAVRAAETALVAPGWADLRPLDRQAMILALAQKLEERADELAFLESVDVGKPVAQAREVDVGGSIDVLRYFAGSACRIDGRVAPLVSQGSGSLGLTLKRPVGVVGAIIPWNFPLQTLVWKAAAALAAGCTLVIKPSEIAPLTALRFAELALEAGLPQGVVNIVNGTGPVTGAALVVHPGVKMITFTGSTSAGRQIGQAALGRMKRLTLELGGKSPVLITAQADLDLAVTGVLNGIFFNAGQICDACESRRQNAHRNGLMI